MLSRHLEEIVILVSAARANDLPSAAERDQSTEAESRRGSAS